MYQFRRTFNREEDINAVRRESGQEKKEQRGRKGEYTYVSDWSY